MKHCRRQEAFTLVEILVVVAILGILGAIVVPQISCATLEGMNASFATNLRTFVNAAKAFHIKTGNYPEDSASGTCPAGLENYITPAQWERSTPLGGVWDSELNSFGYTSSIGVHFLDGVGKDDAYMTEVDLLFDDGNLATGYFRKIAGDRYYYILCN